MIFLINDSKKVAIIGAGMVGTSFAYSLLNQNICNEICLIDINETKVMGDAADLSHGVPFAPGSIKIYAGSYADCKNMDIAVICAGMPQNKGESRRDLLNKNYEIYKSIVNNIVLSGFDGVFLVAGNPVDVMTEVVFKLSGFPKNKVLGSGTSLDSARLRYMIGDYFNVNPRNVHAYVMGEHGDSEFVPWSSAMLSVIPLLDYKNVFLSELKRIEDDVRLSAYEIIKAKGATYYGIGMVLAGLTKAILNDENSIFTVSAKLKGEYGNSGLYIGVPAVVNRNGVREICEIPLNKEEQEKFNHSCGIIKSMLDEIEQ